MGTIGPSRRYASVVGIAYAECWTTAAAPARPASEPMPMPDPGPLPDPDPVPTPPSAGF